MQKFVFVRKYQIIKVLKWLKMYNPLYNDIFINYPLLNVSKDKFIFLRITDHIVFCNLNSQEQESFAALLHDDNFENNLHIVIADTKIEANQLYSGHVHSNINNRKQNPTLKLLSTIDNIKLKIIVVSDIAFPIITYYNKDHFIFLKNWEDHFYFLVAFSTLFF